MRATASRSASQRRSHYSLLGALADPIHCLICANYHITCGRAVKPQPSRSEAPFKLKYNNGELPGLTIAYETWGRLAEDRTNAVLLFQTLSTSSHASSNQDNPSDGWWQKFVGPGRAVDTDEFFVVCSNILGGCHGTTGPSSTNPKTGEAYGSSFPLLSVEDMVGVQFLLLDHLRIQKLHACVGSSMGGMCALLAPALYPTRVGRTISISACCQSDPSAIAITSIQRKCIMSDPDWQNGHYYDKAYPKTGMKLAKQIAMTTFRTGEEWGARFGRTRIDPNEPLSLNPTFEIEKYLDYLGDKVSTRLDPNTLLYYYKAMELFDMSEGYSDIYEGLGRIKCPVLVIGVKTDMMYPIDRQRQTVDVLIKSGNPAVTFYELNSIYGHDSCILDLTGIGTAVKGYLQTAVSEHGWATRHSRADLRAERDNFDWSDCCPEASRGELERHLSAKKDYNTA